MAPRADSLRQVDSCPLRGALALRLHPLLHLDLGLILILKFRSGKTKDPRDALNSRSLPWLCLNFVISVLGSLLASSPAGREPARPKSLVLERS